MRQQQQGMIIGLRLLDINVLKTVISVGALLLVPLEMEIVVTKTATALQDQMMKHSVCHFENRIFCKSF